MSVENLKDYLIENPEEIIKVLELTDFHSISFFDNKRAVLIIAPLLYRTHA